MSEIAGQTGLRGPACPVVHESYSFACMRCGSGWEQSYEIEHHRDAEGHEFVMYVAGGRMVPSPLSKPTCQNCDSHDVRIMRAGQVSSVREAEHRYTRRASQAGSVAPQPPADAQGGEGAEGAGAKAGDHHWHLSDLLQAFHRKS